MHERHLPDHSVVVLRVPVQPIMSSRGGVHRAGGVRDRREIRRSRFHKMRLFGFRTQPESLLLQQRLDEAEAARIGRSQVLQALVLDAGGVDLVEACSE